MNKRFEDIVKRSLKRKVKLSLGFMVAFLITGSVGYAALENAIEFINGQTVTKGEEPYKVEATKHYRGVLVGGDGSLTVNSSIIEINNKSKGDDTEDQRITGVQARKGALINLGNENTSNISIGVDTDKGYSVGINAYTEIDGKTQKINLNGEKLTITSNSSEKDSYGIFVGDEKNTAEGSEVNINSKNATITTTTSGTDKYAIGIEVRDKGIVRANSGNITINAKDAIRVSRGSTVEINKDNNSQNTVILNGNIVFRNDGKLNENMESNVDINLASSESKFDGRIYLSLGDENIPDSERVVNGLKLSISNGASWNVKAEEKEENYIFGDISVKNNGKIIHSGKSLVYNNDGRDLGIQMQGGAILAGNGTIQTGRNLAGQGNTNATNIITVTNTGNIIDTNSNLSFGGNVNLKDNSELINKGTVSTSGSFLVGQGATFTNEKGATITGTANDKHVIEISGGTAINNGTIDLTGTTGSYAMYGDANSTLTNNGTVIVDYKNGNGSKVFNDAGTRTNTNTGIVKVNGYNGNTTLEAKKELEDYLLGAGADNKNTGMIVDENGQAISFGDEVTGEMTVTEALRKVLGTGKLTTGENATITADGKAIEGTEENGLLSLNVTGNLNLKASGSNNSLDIVGITTNLDADGKIVLEGLNTSFKNGTINSENSGVAIDLGNNKLSLEDMIVRANIGNGTGVLNTLGKTSIIGDINTSNVNINSGRTDFDGKLTTGNVNIAKESEGYFSANSSFTQNTTIDGEGTSIFEISSEGNNALKNSGTNKVNVDTNYKFDTSNVTSSTGTIDFGEGVLDVGKFVNDGNNEFEITVGEDGKVKLEYKTDYLAAYGSEINSINNAFVTINDKVNSSDSAVRADLANKVYAGTIYAETVRMAYDNNKLVENELLKLNPEVATGEWAVNGKALYMKNEYTREGVVADYKSEKESTGLLASAEYGLNDTTNLGFAFAGINHELDTDTGKADGDAFYLGAFAKKEVGNYRLTAGLGYEFNRFDADENIFGGSEKYDANVYSAYVEGRYSKDLGDNLTFEPKLKLGYTYVDQDAVEDGTYKLDSQDISVFDTEIGADLVKTVALKDGRLDVVFGASYAMVFGDTDDEFEGRFVGADGTLSSSFNMVGANLAERSANFGLGLGVTKDSGMFYNGGVTFKAGSDNYRDYGVTLGAGYKF